VEHQAHDHQTPSAAPAAQPHDGGPLTLTIENEDTGRDIVLHVGRGETVQHAIDALYRELGRSPDPRDRIRCVADGSDVLPFADEKLKDYLARCPDLRWRFSGPTGGAAAPRLR
jgi:hypothetical protein